MQTRRDFLKSAGLGFLALASSCYTPENSSSPRHYFGSRWNDLSYKDRSRIKADWEKYDDDLKELISNTYKNPQKDFNSPSEDGKENADHFYRELKSNPDFRKQEAYLEIKKISDHFPWINIENPTKQDVVFLREIAETIAYGTMMAQ